VENSGRLIASGTEALPITFTSSAENPAPGDWDAIVAIGGSKVNLSWIDLTYAGYGADPRALRVMDGANFQIHHSRIHHNLGQGILLDRDGLSATLDDVEIDHNSGAAIFETTIDMAPTFNNIRIHDNGLDALLMSGDYIHRNITLDGSPAALNGAPIVITDNWAVVTSGRTLTVTPGTTLKFTSAIGLQAQSGSTINAMGTEDLPIVFTSAAASPAPGSWTSLAFWAGSTSSLSHAEVAYAGQNGDAVRIYSSNVSISQCRVHHSSGSGIIIYNVNITLVNDVLTDNAQAGVSVASGGILTGKHLTLARNATGAWVDSGAQLNLVNTILANNAVGVDVVSGGTAILNYILWDGNTLPVQGVVADNHPVFGHASFAADGYHITPSSSATHNGHEAGVTVDIDGEIRSQPACSDPDLGVDEIDTLYNYYFPAMMKQ
jgi:hypothetical protein